MPDETERLARVLYEADGYTGQWPDVPSKLYACFMDQAKNALAKGVTLAPAPAPAASPALRAAAEAFKDCWHDANGKPGADWRHGEADEYARRVVRAWLEETIKRDRDAGNFADADSLAALRRDLGEPGGTQ
jgi:hypothetical protein